MCFVMILMARALYRITTAQAALRFSATRQPETTMPADFLSDHERTAYQSVPAELSAADIGLLCGLSPMDRQLTANQRRDYNRLGFALQLIIIRLLNHLPQGWYDHLPG